jgi:predicted metal-dependent phosphoesterase TrpH
VDKRTYTGSTSDRSEERLIRLKCDLHTHIIGDRRYEDLSSGMLTPWAFIDLASSLGFDVLSFTYHDYLYQDANVWAYAKQKGIILLPGTERSIDRHHVLLFNCPHAETLISFSEIRNYRRIFQNCLVIAPHPFYRDRVCLGNKLIQNVDCFDAIEYCHFYTSFFNPNRKAVRMARKFGLPMIGCSDAHREDDFATTYSYIYAEERSADAIIKAIKAGRVDYVTSPLPFIKFIKEFLWIVTRLSFVLKGEIKR